MKKLILLGGLSVMALIAGGLRLNAEDYRSKVFTLEELKKYNGRDGMPVYMAVDGIVYDISKAKARQDGTHMKMHPAGNDPSSAYNTKAPKPQVMKNIAGKYPRVGVLASTAAVSGISPDKAGVKGKEKNLIEEFTIDPSKYQAVYNCPVMGKEFKISKDTPALKYNGNEYYFCCPACVGEFKKNPKKYERKGKKK